MNPTATRQGPNHAAVDLGPTDVWKNLTAEVAAFPGKPVRGKFFLHGALGLTGMEVSVNSLPAGFSVPFYHTHRSHEELYLFLRGQGQIQVDDAVVEVREGTAVRVGLAGVRTWRNTGDEPLIYLVIQAPEGALAACGTEDGLSVDRAVVWPD